MSLVCAAAASPVSLFHEGLDPGVRVTLDDRPERTAVVCFAETEAAFTHVRVDATGEHLRLASWRLAVVA